MLPAWSAGLADLDNQDAVCGLRDALAQGTSIAIGTLGVENGFRGDTLVRIALPDAMRRFEGGLRVLGMRRQVEELVTAMNRAAEQALPSAVPPMLSAVEAMSPEDAKAILSGADTAATRYFRRAAGARLTQTFLSIVAVATGRAGLAERYNEIAGKGAQLGLIGAG